MEKLRKVIVISGMTGVGKTNIAKVLASHVNGELVSADSLQVYRGLDILTNKPVNNSAAAFTASPSLNSNLQRAALMGDPTMPGSQQPYHLVNKYDPLNPISSSIYAHDARMAIKDILARNKVPVIEGGSQFYMHQIFNANLTNYNDECFHEARKVARRIIELDGHDFQKTYKRAEDIFVKTQTPMSEMTKIGPNDFYRLENKMAFALFLQTRGLTYS